MNCTHCGPRYSIGEALPYDRERTTIRACAMCPACTAEYRDPSDRRFHAQPNACPACGPQLALWHEAGRSLAARHDALLGAAQALREGRIVAVKGLGAFHLCVDARNTETVARLRARKGHAEKPFALMFRDLETVRAQCEVSPQEASLLASPQAPIVLLPRLAGSALAPGVAPGRPELGTMLPIRRGEEKLSPGIPEGHGAGPSLLTGFAASVQAGGACAARHRTRGVARSGPG